MTDETVARTSTKRVRTFRGAVIGDKGTVRPIEVALNPQVQHYSGAGYELAMANRHKNWAKRYLRARGVRL